MPREQENPCEFARYDSCLKDFLCKVRIERNINFRRKGEGGEISPYCQYNPLFLGDEFCEDRIGAQTSPKCSIENLGEKFHMCDS